MSARVDGIIFAQALVNTLHAFAFSDGEKKKFLTKLGAEFTRLCETKEEKT